MDTFEREKTAWGIVFHGFGFQREIFEQAETVMAETEGDADQRAAAMRQLLSAYCNGLSNTIGLVQAVMSGNAPAPTLN